MKNLGRHVVFDFWGCVNLNSPTIIRKALKEAARACKATLLGIKIHTFFPQGVSGIALLAESHISIHTWPEHKYAAVDVFVCGKKDPYQTIPVFKKYLKPKKVEVIFAHPRGVPDTTPLGVLPISDSRS
ncbi:MAG: adenosylmethionine decarboxylase [Microgenomates group bacterium]